MALITIPRLPDAPEQYDRQQMSQMVQTLEQMIFILNNTYTPETLRDQDEAFAFFLGAGGTTTSEIESNVDTNITNIASSAITTANSNITTNASAITTANSNITTNAANITTITKKVNYLLVTR